MVKKTKVNEKIIDPTKPNKYLTIRQFSEKHVWPSESALRAYFFDSKKMDTPFKDAFIKIGRRVLVCENKFWQIIEKIKE